MSLKQRSNLGISSKAFLNYSDLILNSAF